jgi:hypothetical protein
VNTKSLVIRSVFYVCLFIITTFFPVSCNSKEENLNLAPLTPASISDESLWKRITEETSYTDYSFWPGHEDLKPGQAPHGPFHKVYVNNTLISALPVDNDQVPDGSIIVKENYSLSKQLSAITVMAKVNGYDPTHNDWFWAKYSAIGVSQAAGKLNGCINCHIGMKRNDYIIIQPIDD